MSQPFEEAIFGPVVEVVPLRKTIVMGSGGSGSELGWTCAESRSVTGCETIPKCQLGSFSTDTDSQLKTVNRVRGGARAAQSTQWGRHREEEAIRQMVEGVGKRRAGQLDSFYCSCSESEDYPGNQVCVACGGSGSIDGSHHLVKFM
jgi:hypothetical protein